MPPLETREVWLRGPLPDIPPLLQPVAHALLQAREELNVLTHDFPDELLWERPTDRNGKSVASVGFHLQHLTGVLDRTFTYARGESLSSDQLTALASEENPTQPTPSMKELIQHFSEQVDQALDQLRHTDEGTLTEPRGVGRAQFPSTVIGLLVHAAEHTMRHIGQLSVTARLITL
ncbi:DinB family protein [Spirosoma validum]|uniref:DinB family protein n=1 Tax=Spirosoma validum TaxID=2771355 RepID=A0A927GF29_9BACT|nr:DinB family protein [Spirosoma validum]MBD2755409.1 DinB family protein [Spirosoma validum]